MGIDRPSVAPAAGAIWPVFALAVPLGIVAVVVPALNSAALEQTVVEALIKIVAVVGLYIFIGNSGIMSFGHVAFMAVGAYAAACQTCCPMLKPIVLPGLPDVLLQNTVPNFPASVASGGLAAAVALVAGAVILRLSGIAASIASFALLFIVNVVYSNADRKLKTLESLVKLVRR